MQQKAEGREEADAAVNKFILFEDNIVIQFCSSGQVINQQNVKMDESERH